MMSIFGDVALEHLGVRDHHLLSVARIQGGHCCNCRRSPEQRPDQTFTFSLCRRPRPKYGAGLPVYGRVRQLDFTYAWNGVED